MPIIEAIPKAVKIGKNSSPQSAASYGQGQANAQKSLTEPALFPGPSVPIKYPVTGVSICAVMLKMMVLPSETAQKVSGIISKLNDQYTKQYADAIKKQSQAQTKLFNDLVVKKQKIVDEIDKLKKEIELLEKEIEDKTKKKEEEQTKYRTTIFEYALKAKELEMAGRLSESEEYVIRIEELGFWLAEITTLMAEITNKKLELKFKKNELENKQKLADINIVNNWKQNTDIASDFEVAIPYYPDLPAMPQMPVIPRMTAISDKARTMAIQKAKWMVCPMIPTTGVTISALMLQAKEKAPHSPTEAAGIDAQAEAIIPKLGRGF